MTYQTKIDQYKKGLLSEVERMAFEHELEDNAALREAYEAEQLFNDLASYTAEHLPEYSIVSSESPQKTNSLTIAAVILGLGCILFVSYLCFMIQPDDALQTAVSNEEVKQESPINIKEVQILEEKEDIFIDYQKEKIPLKKVSKPIEEPKLVPVSMPTAATNLPPIENPVSISNIREIGSIATYQPDTDGIVLEAGFSVASTESFSAEIKAGKSVLTLQKTTVIESSEVIDDNSSITYIAGELVVLKPGFSVQPGATFSATVEND